MQIGAMGFVPASQEIGNSKSGQVSEGFGSVLATLTNSEKSLPENGKSNKSGKVLVEENVNMFDLPLMLSTLLNNVNLEKDGIDFGSLMEEIYKIETHLPEMNHAEALAFFLQILSFVKVDQIDLPIDHNSIEQMKSLKMIEWMASKNQDNNLSQLTEFIQKFTDKLQGLVKETNQTNQKEYLSQVFTPLTKEVKERSQGLFQAKPGIFVNEALLIQPQLLKQDGITLVQGQSSKPVTTEQLIQQFESILSKGQFINRGGNQKLFIKLYPEHLGALRVELIQKDSMIIAKLLTTTTAAKELLESQLQSLKHAFSSQNIQVERIEISNGAQFQDRLINKDPQRQQHEQQNQQQQNQDENDQAFEYSFSEELLNVEV